MKWWANGCITGGVQRCWVFLFVPKGIISQLLVLFSVHQITQKKGNRSSLLDQNPRYILQDEILCTFKNDMNKIPMKAAESESSNVIKISTSYTRGSSAVLYETMARWYQKYAKSEWVAKRGRPKHLEKLSKNKNKNHNAPETPECILSY
jgi:hypothetical protein